MGMLVISRKMSQRIYIGDNVVLTVVDINKKAKRARIGVEAPPEIPILRDDAKIKTRA